MCQSARFAALPGELAALYFIRLGPAAASVMTLKQTSLPGPLKRESSNANFANNFGRTSLLPIDAAPPAPRKYSDMFDANVELEDFVLTAWFPQPSPAILERVHNFAGDIKPADYVDSPQRV